MPLWPGPRGHTSTSMPVPDSDSGPGSHSHTIWYAMTRDAAESQPGPVFRFQVDPFYKYIEPVHNILSTLQVLIHCQPESREVVFLPVPRSRSRSRCQSRWGLGFERQGLGRQRCLHDGHGPEVAPPAGGLRVWHCPPALTPSTSRLSLRPGCHWPGQPGPAG